MTERPNICYIFEKLSVQGCQIWHSHVSIPFNSAPAHSTRPHNAKKFFTSSFQVKFLKILNHSQGHIWAGSNKFSRKSKICEFLLWSHVKNKLPKSISGRDCPIISNKGEGVTPSVTTFHCHHSWTISPPWKYFTTLLLLTHIIVDTTQHSFCNNIKTWFHFRQGVLLFQKSSNSYRAWPKGV